MVTEVAGTGHWGEEKVVEMMVAASLEEAMQAVLVKASMQAAAVQGVAEEAAAAVAVGLEAVVMQEAQDVQEVGTEGGSEGGMEAGMVLPAS